MGYSREYLAQRRRALARRRRGIMAGVLVVVLAAGGATAYLLNRTHHVVVVAKSARVHDTPATTATGEYPAAPGAASLKHVKEDLAATTHRHGRATDSASAGSGLLDSGAESSFERLTASMTGHLELAVTPLGAGSTETLGGDDPAHGWSTTKVPVLVSLLRARGSSGLTGQEQSLAQSAITESNNESVLALFHDLERLKGGLAGASGYMEEVLHLGGASGTSVPTEAPPPGAVTTFGQTEWTPDEAAQFFRSLALSCLVPPEQTHYVLGLMESIAPGESWGLGSAGFASVAFKGGWGPEGGGYLVRQSGIVEPGSSSGAAVAIVASAPDFATGTEMLTRTAVWLRTHLRLARRSSTGCGG